MSEASLDRKRILQALQALGDDLVRQDVHGQIFIVGGAAIALAFSTRRVTKDIDAVFEPKAVIYASARRVAVELGLPDDWLNDGVKAYLPGVDEQAAAVREIRGLDVSTASPRDLLAMKLMAMRFGEDDDDIRLLLQQTGIRSSTEALDVVRAVYPHQDPPLKTRLFLEETLRDGEEPSPATS